MNKAELIDAVSAQTSLQKADATRAVDAVFDSITSALKSGDTVALLGFGTFVVKARAARAGRNPRTGETIEIRREQGARLQGWQGPEGCCKLARLRRRRPRRSRRVASEMC